MWSPFSSILWVVRGVLDILIGIGLWVVRGGGSCCYSIGERVAVRLETGTNSRAISKVKSSESGDRLGERKDQDG